MATTTVSDGFGSLSWNTCRTASGGRDRHRAGRLISARVYVSGGGGGSIAHRSFAANRCSHGSRCRRRCACALDTGRG